MKQLLDIRMMEERKRLDGIPYVFPDEFTFFTDVANNSSVQAAYENMQRQYVLRESDRIEFKTACKCLTRIQDRLLQNASWRDYDMVRDDTPIEIHQPPFMKENGNKSKALNHRDDWER